MNRRDSSHDSGFIDLCAHGIVGIRARYFSCPRKTSLFRREACSPRRSCIPPCLPGVCLISELPFRPLCSTPREHDQSPNGPGRPHSFVCRPDRPRPPSRRIYLSYPISRKRKSSSNRPLFFIGMRLQASPEVAPLTVGHAFVRLICNERAKVSKSEIIAFPTYTH